MQSCLLGFSKSAVLRFRGTLLPSARNRGKSVARGAENRRTKRFSDQEMLSSFVIPKISSRLRKVARVMPRSFEALT